jgi:hypothetical protein
LEFPLQICAEFVRAKGYTRLAKSLHAVQLWPGELKIGFHQGFHSISSTLILRRGILLLCIVLLKHVRLPMKGLHQVHKCVTKSLCFQTVKFLYRIKKISLLNNVKAPEDINYDCFAILMDCAAGYAPYEISWDPGAVPFLVFLYESHQLPYWDTLILLSCGGYMFLTSKLLSDLEHQTSNILLGSFLVWSIFGLKYSEALAHLYMFSSVRKVYTCFYCKERKL